jgi:hypothetical protein
MTRQRALAGSEVSDSLVFAPGDPPFHIGGRLCSAGPSTKSIIQTSPYRLKLLRK